MFNENPDHDFKQEKRSRTQKALDDPRVKEFVAYHQRLHEAGQRRKKFVAKYGRGELRSLLQGADDSWIPVEYRASK